MEWRVLSFYAPCFAYRVGNTQQPNENRLSLVGADPNNNEHPAWYHAGCPKEGTTLVLGLSLRVGENP